MNFKKRKTLQGDSFAEQFMSQQEDLSEDNSGQIAFFLGAGASIKAGVPDTFTFVADFIGSLKKNKREQVERIVKILEE